MDPTHEAEIVAHARETALRRLAHPNVATRSPIWRPVAPERRSGARGLAELAEGVVEGDA